MHRFLRVVAIIMITCLLLTTCLTSCSDSSIVQRKSDTSSTLYVGSIGSSFPVTFMPWLSRDGIAPTVCSMMYSTLFSYESATGEYEPSIGKRWCYVKPDGTPLTKDGTSETENDFDKIEAYYTETGEKYAVLRIELFNDIYFHDGERLTVEDVYYSLDLCTDYAFSNHAGALVWTADLRHKSEEGELINQGIFTADHPDYSGTYEINPGEEDTVMYVLINKTYDAITTLFSTILILPEHLWSPIVNSTNQINCKNPEGRFLELYANPVGSGAWMLDRDQTNSQMIVLNRNPNYHLKKEDGTDLYTVDTIKLLLYLDSNTAIFALRKGYIDVLDSSISSNFVKLMNEEEDLLVGSTSGTSATCLTLNINPLDAYNEGVKVLLNNKDVRKAIALSVDQEQLIAKVHDGAATHVSAGLMLKSNDLLYEEKSNILSGNLEEKRKEANELLDKIIPQKDEDGYRLYDGERIVFEVIAQPGSLDLISYLQRQFYEIGLDVLYKAAGSSPETTYLFQSDFDMTIQSVILSMANAGVMLKSHFVTIGRSSNYGNLESEIIAEKIEEMKASLNEEVKIELIKEIQVLLAEEYYKIPLYSSEVISVARTDRFTGFIQEPGTTFFCDKSLENLKLVVKE